MISRVFILFLSGIIFCGCANIPRDRSFYQDMLEQYRLQCISYADSLLPITNKNIPDGKIRHGKAIIKNLISYHSEDAFLFNGEAILQIGSGNEQFFSDTADVFLYAISYGINIKSGIRHCQISPILKFKIHAAGETALTADDFELIDPPELQSVCKQCIHTIKWFPFPGYTVEHIPQAPEYFSLVKLKQIKLTGKQNKLYLRCKFLFQMFYRDGKGCLRQTANRTAMLKGNADTEFDFISQQEFSGAFLKMLSNQEIEFETGLPVK
ncbi:MAG: hypothetical protein E7050_09140 [Lentisphaerae bacterium]|nr:hypothetical protein [Lentisphaerota bacterium]